MNDTIRELTFFLRVSDEASFSAAARSLDLDPSTISKVIQRLENRLGVRLFHRTSRVLKLTQEGERYLRSVRKVVEALEEAEASLAPTNNEPSGVLRIACTAAFARFWLTPLIPSYCEKYPKLRVEFVLSSVLPDLLDHQIDIAFQSGHIADSSFVVRRVATARWRIFGAPSYLARRGTPQTLEDLAQHDCLNYLPGTKLSQWPLQEASQLHIHTPLGRVAADSGDVVCSLTIAGMGLARLSEARVAREVSPGELVSVLDAYQPEGDPIYAIFPSRRNLSVRVRSFLDHIEPLIGR
ncbi:MAG: LysR substrate-binding domain-containing protein [Rhodoferax sp.]